MIIMVRVKNGLGLIVSHDDMPHHCQSQCDDQQLEGPEETLVTEKVFLLNGELPLLGLFFHLECRSTQNKTNLLLLVI
jgi:hypothetical protein